MEATEDDLTAIPTIGPKIAAGVVAYMGNESNGNIIEKLRSAGVSLEDGAATDSEPALQLLAGMRFVVTGRLENFSRSGIEGRIKELGGAVSGSVSRKTNYLIAGEDAGSKAADAEGLGVEIITEEEFLSLLEERANS